MHKILALAQNIGGLSKYRRQMYAANVGVKCWRQMLASNVCGFPKYMRQRLASNLCRIVKLLRHIIYDRNKADVEISVPIQNICVKCMRPSENWRPNSYYLGSAESPTSDFSKSGWRALVQVMLPLLHVVLKWLEHSGRQLIWAASLPYCTGCCTGMTCQNICALSKYLRPHIFPPFSWEKSKT